MKKISILGSTGSIGTQALDVVRKNTDLKVVALSAGNNVELLCSQIEEFKPQLVSVATKEAAEKLKQMLTKEKELEIVYGMEGLISVAVYPEAETLLTAIVGMIGLVPTVEAIKAGKDIALANKETLVTAGHIIMPLAKEYGVNILPVDSEHSAILQCLHGEQKKEISKLLITASGGPFRGMNLEQLKKVKLEDALKHPNWSMGRKITIDSSTLVNKGLEVIEAKWLFDMDVEDIEVVVQPQSIIHSMIELVDGSIIAQLGTPDMRLPIQYALYYPNHKYLDGKRLDFKTLKQITFEQPDMETFKGLALAYEAIKVGGSMPTVYNAANELAVSLFLNKKIEYLDIVELIEKSMKQHELIENPSIEEILIVEKQTHEFINSIQ